MLHQCIVLSVHVCLSQVTSVCECVCVICISLCDLIIDRIEYVPKYEPKIVQGRESAFFLYVLHFTIQQLVNYQYCSSTNKMKVNILFFFAVDNKCVRK